LQSAVLSLLTTFSCLSSPPAWRRGTGSRRPARRSERKWPHRPQGSREGAAHPNNQPHRSHELQKKRNSSPASCKGEQYEAFLPVKLRAQPPTPRLSDGGPAAIRRISLRKRAPPCGLGVLELEAIDPVGQLAEARVRSRGGGVEVTDDEVRMFHRSLHEHLRP